MLQYHVVFEKKLRRILDGCSRFFPTAAALAHAHRRVLRRVYFSHASIAMIRGPYKRYLRNPDPLSSIPRSTLYDANRSRSRLEAEAGI